MSRDESHDHYTITVSAGLGWAGWAGQTNWCGSEKTVSQHEPVFLLSRTNTSNIGIVSQLCGYGVL